MPRPKSFDPETVLAKAMGVFWDKGFDAASIADLTAAMGINRFSLYDTFGDKRTLYLKALDYYEKSVVEPMIERVNAAESLDDIAGYFENLIESQHASDHGPCCLMHKAAVAQSACDDDTRNRVESIRSHVHAAFCDALARCRRNGDIRSGVSLKDTAWVLLLLQAGFAGFASTPVPRRDARAAVRTVLDSLRAQD